MSISGSQLMCDANEDILTNNSQALFLDQQPADHSLLPLLLKKVFV